MKKNTSYIFIVFILFVQSLTAFATEHPLYNIPNSKREYVQDEVKYFFNLKDYLILKEDDKNGYYYITPKHIGTYLNNYMVILLQDGNDTLLYSSADMSNLRTTELLVKHLESNNFRVVLYKDKNLNAAFNKSAKRIYKQALDEAVRLEKASRKSPDENNQNIVEQNNIAADSQQMEQKRKKELERQLIYQSLGIGLNSMNNSLYYQQQMQQTSELMQMNSSLRQMQYNQNRQTNYLPSPQPQATTQRIYVPYTQSTTPLGNPIYRPVNSNYSPISVPQRVFNNY